MCQVEIFPDPSTDCTNYLCNLWTALIVSGYALWKTKIAPRLLLELACGIRHIQSTTAITNRHTIRQYVLAKLHRQLRIERLHKPISKNISRDHVRMARTKDQIAVGMNSSPVERHEAALVAKRVEIVREPVVEIFPTQMARTRNSIRRQQSFSLE